MVFSVWSVSISDLWTKTFFMNHPVHYDSVSKFEFENWFSSNKRHKLKRVWTEKIIEIFRDIGDGLHSNALRTT